MPNVALTEDQARMHKIWRRRRAELKATVAHRYLNIELLNDVLKNGTRYVDETGVWSGKRGRLMTPQERERANKTIWRLRLQQASDEEKLVGPLEGMYEEGDEALPDPFAKGQDETEAA